MRGDVGRDGVGRESCSRGEEPIEDDRDAVLRCAQKEACDGRELEAPDRSKDAPRIGEACPVERAGAVHERDLPRERRVVDPRASTARLARGGPGERADERRGRGGVADTDLADPLSNTFSILLKKTVHMIRY